MPANSLVQASRASFSARAPSIRRAPPVSLLTATRSAKHARSTGSSYWHFRRMDHLSSADKSMFPRASEVAYLDTAAEGLPFPGCRESLLAYFEDKMMGTPGRRKFHEEEHAALCGV